ncbi:hypothetical protein, conserved [Babesia bigemina]|uniref:Uncharacterized protein n=1 Tax=Babesia bigemina TaxID=5866 RepID=A0A061CZ08_BABBI|nr:hypothetical protein, conserved [Babesia bigemina]CDR93856.1 hypothetical protein, conserved [Babesia bigemina]|eukprot:XP_012766042.1 hypothetical protein, conserved [Babesia bigemina]
MNAQFLHTGLGLANYLQSTFAPRLAENGDVPSEFEQPSGRPSRPPAMIRSLIDSGRAYFRLSHQNVLNNLLCVFVPVGKVRNLVPDLYIPAVSISTFLLLRSVYICSSDPVRYRLNDVLARSLTRISLVSVLELLVLTAVLYATSSTQSPMDAIYQMPASNAKVTGSMYGAAKGDIGNFGYGASEQQGAGGRFFGQDAGAGLNTRGHQNNHGAISSPFESRNAHQSQTMGDGAMTGPMDSGHRDSTGGNAAPGRSQDANGATKYFGDHMNMPLTGRHTLYLGQKLLLIGYKYVLLNCYILSLLLAPFRGVTITVALYVSLCSLLFALRTMLSLRVVENRRAYPLLIIFPVLQPLFCYVLLPRV